MNASLIQCFAELAQRVQDETGALVHAVAFSWTDASTYANPRCVLKDTRIDASKAGLEEEEGSQSIDRGK